MGFLNWLTDKGKTPTSIAEGARRSFTDWEESKRRAAEALQSKIGLAEGGVVAAQEASDAALAELRAQAARGMASQFQAAGRRAAGGGTLAALGQAGLDTSRAVSAQRTQDEARIQAAKMAAADLTATTELEIADLTDSQRAAEEQMDAIRAGAPEADTWGKNMDRVRYYQERIRHVADPIVRRLIEAEIRLAREAGTFF